MIIELQLLVVAIVLGIVHLFWAAAEARKQQGLKWAGGSRDDPRPVTGVAARLERAFANYRETFPFFAASVLIAVMVGKTGGLTLVGAVLYVAGRIVYLPLYAIGVSIWRSLAWFTALIGLVLILVSLLL